MVDYFRRGLIFQSPCVERVALPAAAQPPQAPGNERVAGDIADTARRKAEDEARMPEK